ncbi:MAG: hypothetical protein ACE5HT_06605 [Gemmatimonadales bacterium]
MRRRRFLGTVGGAALGIGVLPGSELLVGRRAAPPALKNWAWVQGRGDRTRAEWRSWFTRLKDAGIKALLVSGGYRPLLADAAHAVGLEFHRWIWTLNRNGDEWAKENHPEWYTINRQGESSLDKPPYVGYYKWVCPTRHPVREYLSSVVSEIAADSTVDGVHLDYIRHSDVILPVGLWSKYGLVQDREYPEFDFCYCDVCRERFGRETGRDPMELDDASNDVEWRRFRWNTLTELVSLLSESVHSRGKQISTAVFPTPTLGRRLVRQAWDEWPVDAVFPMMYHEFYNEDVDWIGSATREGAAALSRRTPLFSGLYVPSLQPQELYRAVRLARTNGAAGISLFGTGRLTEQHLAQLERAASE